MIGQPILVESCYRFATTGLGTDQPSAEALKPKAVWKLQEERSKDGTLSKRYVLERSGYTKKYSPRAA